MSTLRYEPTTGDWIAMSPKRAERPRDTGTVSERRAQGVPLRHDPACPFCLGNERETLPAIDGEMDPSDASRWLVRVFPNKYPVVTPEAGAVSEPSRESGAFHEIPSYGHHEILVESPDHSRGLAEQSTEQVERVLAMLLRRARRLASEEGIEHVQIFKNHGAAAGASLAHGHFQIAAMSVVPRQLRLKYQVATDYYSEHGVSVYTELMRAELAAEQRLVAENAEFVAFSPYASRMPYETWIVPRTPAATFASLTDAALPALARMLLDVLGRLARALDDPPYNLVIFSAPHRRANEPDFVWHIEILPRRSTAAGFELSMGLSINPVLPEHAADVLRRAGPPLAQPPAEE